MIHWWEAAYARRIKESADIKSQLRITIYGSFRPASERRRLEALANKLRQRGFPDTDLVEGEKRPNPDKLNSYEISVFYLQVSDVNFLVFTLQGRCKGVTTELDHVLESPEMTLKRSYCVVFNQMVGTRSAVGQLQLDRIRDLGDVGIVPFLNNKELEDSCYLWATDFCKRLRILLVARLPIQ
jgi:hypothetical protein